MDHHPSFCSERHYLARFEGLASGQSSSQSQPALLAGSVSWRLPGAYALHESPDLAMFAGRVSDSGEGRWTIQAAVDEGVPAPVLSAALYGRFSSRGNATVADKIASAMRYGFGGHREKTPAGKAG